MKKPLINHKKAKNSFVRTVLLSALVLASLILIMKSIEYKYLVRELSVELYVSLVATLFTIIGIWIGLRIIRPKTREVQNDCNLDQDKIKELKISRREYQVLQLIAEGCSNQEIAEKLFISLPTVKTHSSNLFVKLDVQRRTQAILKAKELQIIA